MTFADGSSLHYAYDKAGNLIRETDADGGVTRYTYDLLGQITNILSADGTTTEYEYNADGEVVSEFIRNIAYNGEEDGENHYSNLANTSSKPFVATGIRYTEDAINANKGSGFAKPVPKTPTPAKPKVTPQEYAKARKQATTPTQAEYVQLRKSGINMSYGQYVNEKQQARFPSYGQYAYDRSVGKPTYQTFGAVQVVNHQSGTAYYKTPTVTAEATPKVESVNLQNEEYCSLKSSSKAEETIRAIVVAGIKAYMSYLDFKAGSEVAGLKNYGKTAVDLLAGFESIIPNSDYPMAKALNRKISEKIWRYENNIYNSVAHKAGLVFGDFGGIALDIFLLKGASSAAGAAEGVGMVIKGGDTLIAVQESVGALKGIAGLAAGANALWNSTTLGKDLNDLISEIKGNGAENGHIIGENGAQFESKTLWQDNKIGHIDVENPAPGKRDGQIHFQDTTGNKWYYDIDGNFFYNQKTGELAPKSVQKLLEKEEVIKAIQKGLKYLGEL